MKASTIHERHLGWDRALAPVRRVVPGAALDFECLDASGGQLDAGSGVDALESWDLRRVNPLSGPVAIEGARPGDALRVHVVGLEPADWGWTAILPGFGLLADDFDQPWLHVSRCGSQGIEFAEGLRLPPRPFPGTLGVAPAEPGTHSVMPPRRVGGNLDCRDVVEGSVLTLPVEVEDALFSVGDPHAAQGEGEVCGTAVETPMRVRLRFELARGAAPAMPRIEVPPGPPRVEVERGFQVFTGVGPDLFGAARDAVRGAIDFLVDDAGLSPEAAYALCSTSGDLRLSEVVNAPNWVVSLALPRVVLERSGAPGAR